MNKITQMNNYIKDLFTTKKWYMMFILALFSFVGFLLVGVYYIIATVFMIFDTVKVEFDSLLEKKNKFHINKLPMQEEHIKPKSI